jgi:hypothetical protein
MQTKKRLKGQTNGKGKSNGFSQVSQKEITTKATTTQGAQNGKTTAIAIAITRRFALLAFLKLAKLARKPLLLFCLRNISLIPHIKIVEKLVRVFLDEI